MKTLQRRWQEMLDRSFEPRQFFSAEERDHADQEARIMWVYLLNETAGWSVGFYSPDGKWVAESHWPLKSEAAERVHWLNGGKRE